MNDIETLGSTLLRKIWQKITIIDAANHPAKAQTEGLTPECVRNLPHSAIAVVLAQTKTALA